MLAPGRVMMLDCPPIFMPGPGAPWTRLALWYRGETYLAFEPYVAAFKTHRGAELFDLARERNHIPRITHEGQFYVPCWWLIEAFPEAERQINAVRALAISMRDERKKQRGKQ